MSESIAKRWRGLNGQNHWNGLLNPLDNDLRRYLIHYGDLVETTYDTFITESVSRFAGSSRFPMNNLLVGVGLRTPNHPLMKYKVTSYLYAMSSFEVPGSFMASSLASNPWSKQSNWMGYVAVATDEGKKLLGRRDIVVAWRGTITTTEWAKDFDAAMVPATQIFKSNQSPKVHRGFYSVYTSNDPQSQFNKTSARDQVLAAVRKLVEQYKNEEMSITVCGHSLGAALATLSAADIVANGVAGPKLDWFKKGIPVTAFAYACPRVGDIAFKQVLDGMGVGTNSQLENVLASKGELRVLRIVNRPDIVPQSPPTIAGYTHVGQEFLIDSSQSKFLVTTPNALIPHDMEVYLHVIAGTQGSQKREETEREKQGDQGGFKLVINRDVALMNKFLDALKSEYHVAPKWWRAQNKGMMQQPNGNWTLQTGDWILQGLKSDDDED